MVTSKDHGSLVVVVACFFDGLYTCHPTAGAHQASARLGMNKRMVGAEEKLIFLSGQYGRAVNVAYSLSPARNSERYIRR